MQYNDNLLPFKDIQKVYCINVKENVQRREFMETQFNLLEIDPSIIEFIDAVTPSSDEYRKQKRRGKLNYKNKTKQSISLSHKNIWEDIKKNQYYAALVLEDDIEFNISYLKEIKNRISLYALKEKRYFIHLLTSYPDAIMERHQHIRDNLANVNVKYGAGAYVINYKAAFMLSREDWFYPITQPIDDYIWCVKRKLNFKHQYAFLPFICQNASESKTRSFPQQVFFVSNFNK